MAVDEYGEGKKRNKINRCMMSIKLAVAYGEREKKRRQNMNG